MKTSNNLEEFINKEEETGRNEMEKWASFQQANNSRAFTNVTA